MFQHVSALKGAFAHTKPYIFRKCVGECVGLWIILEQSAVIDTGALVAPREKQVNFVVLKTQVCTSAILLGRFHWVSAEFLETFCSIRHFRIPRLLLIKIFCKYRQNIGCFCLKYQFGNITNNMRYRRTSASVTGNVFASPTLSPPAPT